MWSLLCKIIGTPMGWIYGLVGNYGIAIILFTILIKLVLFPISLKQHKSSLAMVRMRPLQDELMKKYGSNRQKYSEELQKLYQREGYSPMSSCLPMLIQMPLLFVMYSVIRRPLTYMAGWLPGEIWETATKYIPDALEKMKVTDQNFNHFESQIVGKLKEVGVTQSVEGKELVETELFSLDLAAIPSEIWKTAFWILIIPILSGVTSFLLSWLSQKMNPAQQVGGQGGGMKMMLYVMPLISLWIAFGYTAGLGIYWTFSNVLGIAQLYILNAMYNPKKIEAEMQAKIDEEKAREKEKRALAAQKKAMAVQGKKKRKKVKPSSVNPALTDGENSND